MYLIERLRGCKCEWEWNIVLRKMHEIHNGIDYY